MRDMATLDNSLLKGLDRAFDRMIARVSKIVERRLAEKNERKSPPRPTRPLARTA
jgi:hypothetical protein